MAAPAWLGSRGKYLHDGGASTVTNRWLDGAICATSEVAVAVRWFEMITGHRPKAENLRHRDGVFLVRISYDDPMGSPRRAEVS